MKNWSWMRSAVRSAALATAVTWCAGAAAEENTGGGDKASARPWQASVQGRWFTGLGEAKGSIAESGAPDAGAGYGLRLERKLSDWWSAGVALSTSPWSVTPVDETNVLRSGSFVDLVLVLKLEPVRFDIPGGPLSFYFTGSGGPTLSGETQFVSERAGGEPEAFESVQFDAGLAAGASAGISYRPAERLSVFLEAGIDWHYAVHGRRTIALDAIVGAEPLPPVLMERLWVGQGVVGAGVALHF